ncbi:hypothetical protein H2248_005572 [Termitomyces sp. 'cryptogamus']|nr:hypothetical protein H2248_005572 [Termitomyces sp. 'cryptogamus']
MNSTINESSRGEKHESSATYSITHCTDLKVLAAILVSPLTLTYKICLTVLVFIIILRANIMWSCNSAVHLSP